jgi:hypothetical protein
MRTDAWCVMRGVAQVQRVHQQLCTVRIVPVSATSPAVAATVATTPVSPALPTTSVSVASAPIAISPLLQAIYCSDVGAVQQQLTVPQSESDRAQLAHTPALFAALLMRASTASARAARSSTTGSNNTSKRGGGDNGTQLSEQQRARARLNITFVDARTLKVRHAVLCCCVSVHVP